ncbi:MAG: hypothetical protein QXD66_00410 [Candidatus Nezhaarchaeales archaeon]
MNIVLLGFSNSIGVGCRLCLSWRYVLDCIDRAPLPILVIIAFS